MRTEWKNSVLLVIIIVRLAIIILVLLEILAIPLTTNALNVLVVPIAKNR